MVVRKYENGDLDAMVAIWNEVVEAGDAFPRYLSVFQGEMKG